MIHLLEDHERQVLTTGTLIREEEEVTPHRLEAPLEDLRRQEEFLIQIMAIKVTPEVIDTRTGLPSGIIFDKSEIMDPNSTTDH